MRTPAKVIVVAVFYPVALVFLALVFADSAIALEGDSGAVTYFATPQSSRGGDRSGSDRGMILAESPDGSIWATGIVDAFPSDTGGLPGKPLLAKFSAEGTLLWQYVYDRPGWSILGLNATSENTSLIFWFPEPGNWYQLDTDHESFSEHGRAELWTTRPDGHLDENLMTLHHRVSRGLASTHSDGFTLTLGQTLYGIEGQNRKRLDSHDYEWSGKRSRRPVSFELPGLPYPLADNAGAMAGELDSENVNETYITYFNLITKQSFRHAIGNCALCRVVVAFRTQDGVVTLVTKGDWKDPHRTAYLVAVNAETGEVTRKAEIPELAYLDNLKMHSGQDGDLLVSGREYLASVIAQISGEDYSIDWVKRFRAGPAGVQIQDVVERRDGRLIITGSDGESNAVLITGHPQGEFFEALGRCTSPGFELATLHHKLAKQRRIKLYINPQHTRESVERSAPAGHSFEDQTPCDSDGEADTLELGSFLLNFPMDLGTKALSETSLVSIRSMPVDDDDTLAFRYVPQYSASPVPAMLVNVAKKNDVAVELATNVLPYMKEVEHVNEALFKRVRHVVSNGNSNARSGRYYAGVRRSLAVSPADYAQAIDSLWSNLEKLDDPVRQKISRSVDRLNVIAIVPGTGITRRVFDHVIELPLANIDHYWQWIQGDSRLLAMDLFEAETRLKRKLNILFVNTPDTRPEDHLMFVEQLVARLDALSRSPRRVPLEFVTDTQGKVSIRLSSIRNCKQWASAGINVEDLATKLSDSWACLGDLTQ